MNKSEGKLWDIAIAGAGPAGAVCAYRLAQRGHSVLLIDKQAFPRDKACGDFLIGDALQILDELGFHDEVDGLAQHSHLMSVRYEKDCRIELKGEFVTLTRRVFDNYLWKKAIDQGVTFCTERVGRISNMDNRTFAQFETESGVEIRARYAVVATGADSVCTRKALHLSSPGANAFAFRKYIVSTTRIPETIIVYHRSIQPGYAWIIPVEHEGEGYRYNIGAGWPTIGVNRSRHIDDVMTTALTGVPEATALLKTVLHEGKWRGAPLKCGLTLNRCVLGDRTVAIGEAVGTTYPFTGEGIGKAMLSACYAADGLHDALDRDDRSALSSYPERLRDLVPRYNAFAQIERLLARPSTSRFLLNRLRKSPFLMNIADDVFHKDVSPEPLIKPLNILRSFWR